MTWDAATGRELERRAVSCPVSNGPRAYSRDGRLMASAVLGAEAVTVWDLAADRPLAVIPAANPSRPSPLGRAVSCLALSPDGATLAVAREDGTAEFWDLKSVRLVRYTRVHHLGFIAGTLRFTPDGAALVSVGGFQRPVAALDVLWDAATAWWPRARRRSVASEAVVFDVASGRRLARLKSVTLPLLSDDGRTLATSDIGAFSFRLWDMPPTRRAGAP